ncbi:MAG: DUF998 domain-containing protein [Steroidobacteraceae bacterium]
MNRRKTIGIIAVVTPFWFLAVYLIMAGLRPEYSYLTKAISELGSVHAPHRWIWNIFGFITPGLAIALLGVGLKSELSDAGRSARVPALAVTASGLFMALAGVFPGNFINRTAPTMIMHTIGAYGSGIFFLIAGFWLPFVFRKRPHWRWLAWLSLGLVFGMLAGDFLVGAMRHTTPGLGQRVSFAYYFLWIGVVGYALMRSASLAPIRNMRRSAAGASLP